MNEKQARDFIEAVASIGRALERIASELAWISLAAFVISVSTCVGMLSP